MRRHLSCTGREFRTGVVRRLNQKDERGCILFPGTEPERKRAPESAILLAFEDEGAEVGPNASANAATITSKLGRKI